MGRLLRESFGCCCDERDAEPLRALFALLLLRVCHFEGHTESLGALLPLVDVGACGGRVWDGVGRLWRRGGRRRGWQGLGLIWWKQTWVESADCGGGVVAGDDAGDEVSFCCAGRGRLAGVGEDTLEFGDLEGLEGGVHV